MSKSGNRLYSEAFKLQVVREIEEGRFRSAYEAAEAYGVGARSTVYRWLREYGKNHLIGKVIHVRQEGEPSEIQRLKERVDKLESALADAHMNNALNEAFYKLACKEAGLDPDAFKKKVGGTLSTSPEGPFRSEPE